MAAIPMKLVMDDVSYQVRVTYDSVVREFALLEGPNAGTMLSGREERDLLGTAYSYEMTVLPDPTRPEDYDAFYQAVSAPVDTHKIVLPYGQTTITYQARILSGQDRWRGRLGGADRWSGLSIRYEYVAPQRTPD